ncbi:DUF4148 domain-containing protein [Hydrogenophaga sp. PAMC20947]|uniref:DUF4148 domain-containing protein n=1 Tax=Hydrogenophaga sp. PAMC20947 TaxID=2565558 RepID=UPI00109DE657|nr:DUF4148 domain-containing protein [Hydrogenophaga sp. PAMC20947]QCB46412.1 DUF4148 domain-containing protein [Hydrogenophaga sp. PAMC20947]
MKSFVIATLLATTAFAASAMPGNGQIYGFDTVSTSGASKTRAEVIAELRQAQAAGTLAYGESSSRREKRAMNGANGLTRAEVRMELAELGKDGAWFVQGPNAGIYRN